MIKNRPGSILTLSQKWILGWLYLIEGYIMVLSFGVLWPDLAADWIVWCMKHEMAKYEAMKAKRR